MKYQASMDSVAKVITTVVMSALVFFIYRDFTASREAVTVRILISGFFAIVFLVAYLFAPQYYLIQDSFLIIVRPVGNIKIRLEEIHEVRLIKKQELGSLIRTGGSGGLFGYYGLFRSTRLGKLRMYATRLDPLILITTADDDRLIISPTDLSIVNALRQG